MKRKKRKTQNKKKDPKGRKKHSFSYTALHKKKQRLFELAKNREEKEEQLRVFQNKSKLTPKKSIKKTVIQAQKTFAPPNLIDVSPETMNKIYKKRVFNDKEIVNIDTEQCKKISHFCSVDKNSKYCQESELVKDHLKYCPSLSELFRKTVLFVNIFVNLHPVFLSHCCLTVRDYLLLPEESIDKERTRIWRLKKDIKLYKFQDAKQSRQECSEKYIPESNTKNRKGNIYWMDRVAKNCMITALEEREIIKKNNRDRSSINNMEEVRYNSINFVSRNIPLDRDTWENFAYNLSMRPEILKDLLEKFEELYKERRPEVPISELEGLIEKAKQTLLLELVRSDPDGLRPSEIQKYIITRKPIPKKEINRMKKSIDNEILTFVNYVRHKELSPISLTKDKEKIKKEILGNFPDYRESLNENQSILNSLLTHNSLTENHKLRKQTNTYINIFLSKDINLIITKHSSPWRTYQNESANKVIMNRIPNKDIPPLAKKLLIVVLFENYCDGGLVDTNVILTQNSFNNTFLDMLRYFHQNSTILHQVTNSWRNDLNFSKLLSSKFKGEDIENIIHYFIQSLYI